MPKYMNQVDVAYLWRKLQNQTKNNLIYYSKSAQQWNLDISIISEKNVLYIYTNYKTIEQDGEEILLPGLKVGDGTSYLIDLPFLNSEDNSAINQQILDHINDNVVHITAEERSFWNNKLNYQSQLINETLVLNKQ